MSVTQEEPQFPLKPWLSVYVMPSVQHIPAVYNRECRINAFVFVQECCRLYPHFERHFMHLTTLRSIASAIQQHVPQVEQLRILLALPPFAVTEKFNFQNVQLEPDRMCPSTETRKVTRKRCRTEFQRVCALPNIESE